MSDHPIAFSGPMVGALLAGRKTMMREAIKLPTKGEYVRPDMGGWAATTSGGEGVFTIDKHGRRHPEPEQAAIWNQTTGTCLLTRYQVGDRLWVREAHYLTDDGDREYAVYAADAEGVRSHMLSLSTLPAEFPSNIIARHRKLRSLTRMPRWASRLTLIVESVKVERLQDISEADAIAEGVVPPNVLSEPVMPHEPAGYAAVLHCVREPTAKDAFRTLWGIVNGPEAWTTNPFVAMIQFSVILSNIDAIKEAGDAGR